MAELLSDMRVVELADGPAAAFCGKLFARLGADVLAVERPRTGSEVRWQGPFLDDVPGAERSGLFLYTAAGKRSLTLDAGSADGQAILKRLLSRADLLIEDRGAEMPLFADDQDLSQLNPRLIHLTLLKFSRGGPYEKYAATELQMAALGGWMVQLGEPGRTPLVSNSTTMTAFVPGIFGAIAALAAVGRARQTGEGERLDLSAHEALLFTTRFNETFYSYTGIEIKRNGNSFPGFPAYRVFKAADGDVASAAASDAQIQSLLKLAEVDPERFPTRQFCIDHVDEFAAEVGRWFARTTRDEAFHRAQELRIPMGKVATIDEVASLEQLADRRFFEEVDHPVAGRRLYPGGLAQFSETPTVSRRAPLLGEHTREVLCDELGYAPQDVAALAELGVI
jgi:crotonobetainyl-CoA:carnitine CoA-transferase CaiB-like acyl-CoA transferase